MDDFIFQLGSADFAKPERDEVDHAYERGVTAVRQRISAGIESLRALDHYSAFRTWQDTL